MLVLRLDKDKKKWLFEFKFKLKPSNPYPRGASEGLRHEIFLMIIHFSFVTQNSTFSRS